MSILSKVVGLISRNDEGGGNAVCFGVMSTMTERPGERKILARLAENGLTAFHLRRPHWTLAQHKSWLDALPAEVRSRVVVHAFPQLVRRCGLAGFQLPSPETLVPAGTPGEISAQCEDYQAMLRVGKNCARIMLGPVFPPKKYDVTVPRRTLGEYAAIASYWRRHGGRAKVVAFGGVDASNVHLCRRAGFDGFVVVGAVWDAPDPVKAFANLVRKW